MYDQKTPSWLALLALSMLYLRRQIAEKALCYILILFIPMTRANFLIILSARKGFVRLADFNTQWNGLTRSKVDFQQTRKIDLIRPNLISDLEASSW
jgi:hypothetical protein